MPMAGRTAEEIEQVFVAGKSEQDLASGVADRCWTILCEQGAESRYRGMLGVGRLSSPQR